KSSKAKPEKAARASNQNQNSVKQAFKAYNASRPVSLASLKKQRETTPTSSSTTVLAQPKKSPGFLLNQYRQSAQFDSLNGIDLTA
ncbi:MAG: hypothetical protein D6814_04500, partial [Calditrichaeota bacterium]